MDQAHLKTWIRSDICDFAGVPDTASDERRGIKETISLQNVRVINTIRRKTYAAWPPPTI